MILAWFGEHGPRHMAFACSRQEHDFLVMQRATTSDVYRLTCARLGQGQRFQASMHASARAYCSRWGHVARLGGLQSRAR